MISYTTSEYYTNKYLQGKQAVIDAPSFPLYTQKATQRIKRYTFDNIDEAQPFTDEVQMCCCELAEYLFKQDNSGHDTNISSEKVGEFSVSYVSGQTAEDIKQSTIKEIIYNWLAGTGLLYRGCV
jgi:hypothetical protein